MEKSEIDTPALVIDLDLVEMNLKTLAEWAKGLSTEKLRSYAKRYPKTVAEIAEAGQVRTGS